MALASAVDIGLPDHISGPLRGFKSAAMSVAMFRAMMEGHIGVPPFWAWNASSSGQFYFFEAAWFKEERAVTPKAPWPLRMDIHEFLAEEQ
jgi:hypothetical protein